ncbi:MULTISPECIES: Nif11-like leader peptide family natural product precursor [unclassified Nodularia (in: cyanobacteria)]|uniref:Nif11-like leader peptide family natural product precursor n=1 Tax=unclassified Nodularia (in: cyanobacteria) TaxID=2656917 RepID=UPI001880CFB5|nr:MULTISPECIES: Nif11-like leader peptide family natural product precursor [unclassified Nodularia (in: cyanobacteria)]MBE9198372.1 Nif11-like leader peptide family natural product precursor [Nodularia sp. LEGE 06071]MCC2691163.1 Nif11-like leader peptide family natural product precursor [Nodularia sp. LEGE 04288]
MSVQTALQFIQQLRMDEGLKSRLLALNNHPDLASFVKLGAEFNLTFTVEELKTAHKHDWGMRWLLHNSRLEDNRQ